MTESISPDPPPPAKQPTQKSQQESRHAPPPAAVVPPGTPPLEPALRPPAAAVPAGTPQRETEKEKRADRPHGITIFLAASALVISIASAILQQVNAVQARKEAAQAAEKQAADVERSRIAAEKSAEAAGILAVTTQDALKLQSRGTTAIEKSAEASGSLARNEQIIREILARSQSARLMVSLEPYKDPKSGADSRRLLLVNGTLIPALRVEVGYEIHTLGMADQTDLIWKLTWNEPEPLSESADFYLKQIEKLRSRYSRDFLAPGTVVAVADTLPAPKWFLFRLKDSSSIPVPAKYTSTSTSTSTAPSFPALRPAVVFGYVKYADNANKSKKVPFCLPLDPKKTDLNCKQVNPTE